MPIQEISLIDKSKYFNKTLIDSIGILEELEYLTLSKRSWLIAPITTPSFINAAPLSCPICIPSANLIVIPPVLIIIWSHFIYTICFNR